MTSKERCKIWYFKHKKEQAEKSRIKFQENREAICARRKERMKLETPEKREKRLKFHKEYNKAHKEIMRGRLQQDSYKFKQYEGSALRRGYEFSLSFEEFVSLFHGTCIYCGRQDCRGIDRVSNELGYTKENSSSCCEMCNKMKWKWSQQSFLEQVKKIYLNSFN